MNIYQGDDAPCYKCAREIKSYDCHGYCKDYIEYAQRREKDRKERAKIRDIAEVQYFASMRRRRARSRK